MLIRRNYRPERAEQLAHRPNLISEHPLGERDKPCPGECRPGARLQIPLVRACAGAAQGATLTRIEASDEIPTRAQTEDRMIQSSHAQPRIRASDLWSGARAPAAFRSAPPRHLDLGAHLAPAHQTFFDHTGQKSTPASKNSLVHDRYMAKSRGRLVGGSPRRGYGAPRSELCNPAFGRRGEAHLRPFSEPAPRSARLGATPGPGSQAASDACGGVRARGR